MKRRVPLGRPAERGERGQVGGIEAIAFGVLVLVLGILGLATAWAVVDTKVAAASAALEAARSYVESDGSDSAWLEAAARGREAFAGHGRDGGVLDLPRPAESFGRCGPITVIASTNLDLPRLPGRRSRGHLGVDHRPLRRQAKDAEHQHEHA